MKTPIVIDGEHTPKPEGDQVCDFCDPPKHFENWDLLACHITIVHNENGRKKSYYGNTVPQEILNHPDWTGFEEETS